MASSKTFINFANKYDRIVVLVDMDCFYCQVEEKLDPTLKGKPIAVVQYNAWKGGGIIACNYAAREQGVTRHMRGDEAKEQCPEIVLVKVPSVREKADLTKYREAGKEVAIVLQKFTPLLERASVDEAYLDITEEVVKRLETMNQGNFRLKPNELTNTYVVGYENIGAYVHEISDRIEHDTDDFHCDEDDLIAVKKSDIKLLLGAAIANEIRAKVKERTGYDCSAGIAHNKILAKLACGINKPNKQTLLPLRQIEPLYSTLPVGKIKGLGGKFGEDLCEILGIKFVGDLLKFSESELQRRFDEKNGSWLYLLARGIDLEAVTPRFYSKSIGCCKKFPGRNAISSVATLEYWLSELANEICERMEKDIIENNRKAKQMVVSYIQEIQGDDISSSRSVPLPSHDPDAIAKCGFEVIRKNTDHFLKPNVDGALNNALKFLGISVGKFETIETNKNTIQKMFLNHNKKKEMSENQEQVMKRESNNDQLSETAETKSEPNKKKSFFVNYFKNKQIDEEQEEVKGKPEVVGESSCESGNSKPKSFFLNALKRNIVDQKADPPASAPFDTTSTVIQEPGPSSNPPVEVYTHTYAEFSVPEPKEQDFVACEKCGKKILSFDVQTHNDFHFAFELSQVQRYEFRSDVKSKMTSPPSKKPKKSNKLSNRKSSQPKTNNETSIQKFLKKEIDSVEEQPPEGKEKCSECGNLVHKDKMVEHIDFHAAKKIQIAWNKELMVTERSRATKTARDTVKTLKRSTTEMKNIKTFFATQS